MLLFDKFAKCQNSHFFRIWVLQTFGKWCKGTCLTNAGVKWEPQFMSKLFAGTIHRGIFFLCCFRFWKRWHQNIVEFHCWKRCNQYIYHFLFENVSTNTCLKNKANLIYWYNVEFIFYPFRFISLNRNINQNLLSVDCRL